MTELEHFQKQKPNESWPEHWIKLHSLLQPIEWNWSSDIYSRQNLVVRERNIVLTVRPFLTGKALLLARQWLKEETRSGLWD